MHVDGKMEKLVAKLIVVNFGVGLSECARELVAASAVSSRVWSSDEIETMGVRKVELADFVDLALHSALVDVVEDFGVEAAAASSQS